MRHLQYTLERSDGAVIQGPHATPGKCLANYLNSLSSKKTKEQEYKFLTEECHIRCERVTTETLSLDCIDNELLKIQKLFKDLK